MNSRKIAIIGAGLSGLISCKHVKEKGFTPIVFGMRDDVGGVWLRTLDSTLTQTYRLAFQFSDFRRPAAVPGMDFLCSTNFQLLQLNSKVVGMDFVENFDSREFSVLASMDDAWSSEAFRPGGKWHISVLNAKEGCSKVSQTVDSCISGHVNCKLLTYATCKKLA